MKSLLVILFFFLNNIVWGQSIIKGVVLNEKQEGAEAVFIQLLKSDTTTLQQFCLSDESGKWNFHNLPSGNYWLRIGSLGYKTQIIQLKLNDLDTLTFNLSLEVESYMINTVEVIAENEAIIKKGDTLIYNINKFANGTEETLGDILQQLPGIEVSENGQISYNGKRVDKLLIEGKNVLNNQHQLATEGISAIDLQNIAIIEQYSDVNGQKSAEWSNSTALDIRLKETSKHKWTGNIKPEIGYLNKYNGNVNTLNISDKVGVTGFLKLNNIGIPVISTSDYLSLQTSLLDILNQTGGELDKIIPKGLFIPSDLSNNNDFLFASNIEYESKPKLKIQSSVLIGSLKKSINSEFTRYYLNDTSIVVGKEIKENKFAINNFNLLIKYQFTEGTTLTFNLPLNINSLQEFNNQEIIINKSDKLNTLNHNDLMFSILPKFDYRQKIQQNSFLNFSINFNAENRNEGLILQNEEGLILNIETDLLTQKIKKKSIFLQSEIQFEQKIKPYFWGVKLNNVQGNYSFLLEKMWDDTTTQHPFNIFIPQNNLEFYGGFKTKHLLVQPRLKIRQFIFNDQKSSKPYLIPELVIRYNFNPIHFILFNYNHNYSNIAFDNLINTPIIQDFINIKQNDVPENHIVATKNMSLNYFVYNVFYGINIHCNANYSFSTLPINQRLIVIDDIFLTETIITPEGNQSKFILNIDKRFKKIPFRMITKFDYLNNQGIISVNGNNNNKIVFQRWKSNISIQSTWEKKINFNISYNYGNNKQETVSNTFFFSSNIYSLNTTYHDKKITIENDIQIIQNKNNIINNITKWDCLINYKFDKYPISLSLSGSDLLNIKTSIGNTTSFTNIYIQNQIFSRFPGYILLGCKYKF